MPKLGKTIAFASDYISPNDVDKLEIRSNEDFHKIVEQCRFFYKKDPLSGSVVDRTVDISINDLLFNYDDLSDNEARVFDGIKPKLLEFASACAMEYLISGLVIPEVGYESVDKDLLNSMGVKKYNSLILPVSMWIRDPMSVIIKSTMISDKPSYFVKVNQDMIDFIKSKGRYNDGSVDREKYNELKRLYSAFVNSVEAGQLYIPINPPVALRRRVVTGSCYPTPYLYRSLEAMKHKRNLRRMDYSLASRVITAIQLFKLGSDEFPVTEDDAADQFGAIKDQMSYRNSMGADTERIYQLFANHTLQIEWVMPDTQALLDDAKYSQVNADIMYGLGFPRILITGETERSNSSDPEFASLSPIKNMQQVQREILGIINWILKTVAKENNFRGNPTAAFLPINLQAVSKFMEGLADLYATGNLSRESYAAAFGYAFTKEAEQRSREDKELEKLNLTPIAAKPFSNTPEKMGENNDKTQIIPQ